MANIFGATYNFFIATRFVSMTLKQTSVATQASEFFVKKISLFFGHSEVITSLKISLVRPNHFG